MMNYDHLNAGAAKSAAQTHTITAGGENDENQ